MTINSFNPYGHVLADSALFDNGIRLFDIVNFKQHDSIRNPESERNQRIVEPDYQVSLDACLPRLSDGLPGP
jgi:hypothetical protein